MFYLPFLADVLLDLRLALAIVMFIFMLNWAKSALGSPKWALLVAGVLAYLTIIKHPDLIWAGLVILLAGAGVFNAFMKSAK